MTPYTQLVERKRRSFSLENFRAAKKRFFRVPRCRVAGTRGEWVTSRNPSISVVNRVLLTLYMQQDLTSLEVKVNRGHKGKRR